MCKMICNLHNKFKFSAKCFLGSLAFYNSARSYSALSLRNVCRNEIVVTLSNCSRKNLSAVVRTCKFVPRRLLHCERSFIPNVVFKRVYSKAVPEQNVTKGKVKISKGEFRRLLSLAKPEKWKLTGAIAFLIVSSTITMAVPFALGKVIDTIYTADTAEMKERLSKLASILVGVFLLGGACNFGRVYLMSIAGQRITRDLRSRLFAAMMRQETGYFDTRPTGALLNRLSADTTLVAQTITSNISDGLRSSVMVVAGLSMMFYMSPELAAVSLSVVPPVAVLAVLYGRFVKRITREVQDSLADATSVAQERIANIRTVKAFSNEEREVYRYNEKLKHVLKLTYKESLAKGLFFGMTGLSGNMIILTVLYQGGIMVGDSALSVGALSSFLLYAAYIGVSIGGLSSFYSELNKGLGATARLWEILDRVPAITDTAGLRPEKAPLGTVRFENINFSYPSRPETTVLQNMCLELKAGSLTAVVGGSGSGKSTIASLLLRLYDPESGNILLDGTRTDKLDLRWMRSHVGYVSQEPVLFSCSLRDNILYGADVSEAELQKVIQEANCEEFIRRLPLGLDTVPGEQGVMLSGGQRQRITIARALIKNPRILVLDEATSALDAESEHLVQDALQRVMKDRTVLTIAHRLSTVRNADLIAVLQQGSIVESGSYDQLVNKDNGAFRRLVQHQAFL